jgi:hypothetical protein
MESGVDIDIRALVDNLCYRKQFLSVQVPRKYSYPTVVFKILLKSLCSLSEVNWIDSWTQTLHQNSGRENTFKQNLLLFNPIIRDC